jgi:hypothetical protein
VGLSVVETSVAGEEGTVSSSVTEQSVEIEAALERPKFETGGSRLRALFFGVNGVERESRFGAVLDLWTRLLEELGSGWDGRVPARCIVERDRELEVGGH